MFCANNESNFHLLAVWSVCQVSLEFTPSSAVPGEETTMQVKADPASLCGVSAIDKSVLIKEPGQILDAEKVTTARQHHQSLSEAMVNTSFFSVAGCVF